MHWLGCAVFVECRSQTVSTVGKSVVVGNFVNVTSLLRYCNLRYVNILLGRVFFLSRDSCFSLIHFFDKINKWADMANLSENLRQEISDLKGDFACSYYIFKAYIPMFASIFKLPNDTEQQKHHKKQRYSL